jgi:phosphomannomutase
VNQRLDRSSQTSNLFTRFIDVNRALTASDDPERWPSVAGDMEAFLDEVAALIRSSELQSRWSPLEQARLFAALMTVLAEAGQYRHEAVVPSTPEKRRFRDIVESRYLPIMGAVRDKAVAVTGAYLSQPTFAPLADYIRAEITPLLSDMSRNTAPDRFMPFRVLRIADIVERLFSFHLRTSDPHLKGDGDTPGLLFLIYQFKYLRFGTSGVRGRWGKDFTEARAKQVVQAICDYLTKTDLPSYISGEDLRGRRIVIGYDSRLNARRVAEWVAEVCLANGFKVDLANRDTPTPALVYYMTDHLPADAVAALINCTASHNPPEWQGIKFNPRQGWPAPTNLTDFIAARINEIQILDRPVKSSPLTDEIRMTQVTGFDPITLYTRWILNGGGQRIPIDQERIRKFFAGKFVVVDEMHGAGRGYLTRLLGEIGVRYTVIHAETDPTLPGLDYANPEEPFVEPLKKAVRESGAALGLGMDTDADRFGVVDQGGQYFRPNQILPILTRYLGVDRKLAGRVIATQTGSPLIEPIAALMSQNGMYTPTGTAIPAYVTHPFYRARVGDVASRAHRHTFMVPVGIKYIEEQRRTDREYNMASTLPNGWRDTILLGGEESSGLTTRGHVTDKDGVWANLLVMDMLAYYGSTSSAGTIDAIWRATCELEGCWPSYGGREHEGSHSGRLDADAILEAKEGVVDYFLDRCGDDKLLPGLEVVYCGGVRYDVAEMQLRHDHDARHFLRVRMSGTEPINRFYVESSEKMIAKTLLQTAANKLEDCIADQVTDAKSEWRLAEILVYTKFSTRILAAIKEKLGAHAAWSPQGLASKLQTLVDAPGHLESRNRRMTNDWIAALRG